MSQNVQFIKQSQLTNIGIELVTKIKWVVDDAYDNNTYDNNKYRDEHIYKYTYTNCVKYFAKPPAKYIGIIQNDTLHVCNLEDDDFTDEFKAKFNNITTVMIQNQNVYIDDFRFLGYLEREPCMSEVKLDNAKNRINDLNNKLDKTGYKLSIDYVFNIKTDTEITSFGFHPTMLLLGVYKDTECVASLVLGYDETTKMVSFSSKTNKSFKNKRLFTLLTAVIIQIAKEVFPQATQIYTTAVHISAYVMIYHFGAEAFNESNNNSISFNLNENISEQINKYINRHGPIVCKVYVDDYHIELAKKVFDETVKKLRICKL